MKIVIAVEEFDPRKGYLEYHLATELAKMGHQVYVFTFSLNDGTVRTFDCEGFTVFSLPCLASVNPYHLPSPICATHIVKFLKTARPDIIHCQPIGSPLSLIFISWSNFFKYSVVGSIESQLNLIFSPWSMMKKVLFCISKIVVSQYAAKKSKVIFAKSGNLMKIISKSYDVPLGKFSIIPLGTDPELFKFSAATRTLLRRKLGLSAKDVVVVYSGKINPSKGIDLLINALSPIMAQNDKVKLLIVGDGKSSYIEYLKKLAFSLRMSSNIIFYPSVHRTKLPDFYSASDIAVWPGLSSISIVDAASVGLPLIIANTPVEIYAVDYQNGFVFSLGNVGELQEYLRRLIDYEKLRKDMGHRSRLLVERKLNWASVTARYFDAYNHALGH